MPYIKNTYRYKNVVEIERVHSGRFGKAGHRAVRKQLTPEEMARVNERNAVKKLRRKIQANFDTEDLFETLTYKREERPEPAEAKKRLKKLLDGLRRTWKQAGVDLKYIVVTEYANTAIHHHLVVNDLPDGTGPKVINRFWRENGGAHTKYLYEDGQYELLAAYLIKETNKNFRKPGNPAKLRYSCSRNLINPQPVTEMMKRDDWPEEPRVPKGHYLDKPSLHNGVNKMGYRYQYYRLIKLGKIAPAQRRKKPASDSVNTEWEADLKNQKRGGKKSHGNQRRKGKNHQTGDADHQKIRP